MLNPADAAFAETLARRLPGLALRPADARYLEEPRRLYPGQPGFVARPAGTDEVAGIVRACGAARVGIVPYGGGTGLVGGQTAPDGPVPLIVSLERMTRVRAVYPAENTLVAEAGATLAAVQGAAEAAGRLFPLSYASKDSATLGGALSVNSGGLNVLRYGMARALCLGVEAVLPDGSVIHGLKRLRKDNTGYDLRGLLIGAEGTLGIVTAAALALSPRPARVATAMLEVAGPAAALDLLARLQEVAGETVSAFELISAQGLAFLAETLPEVRQPFAEPPAWSVLAELGMSEAADPEALLGGLYATAFEAGLVGEGVIASGEGQRAQFWHLRESIPVANRRIGAIASHDISLPLGEIPGFLDSAPEALRKIAPVRINAFGHLGDGNLHFNAFPPKGEDRDGWRRFAPAITGLVQEMVMERGGSFSAEHGIGRAKVAALARYGDPAKLAAMRAIKAALDPAGIMNPGAVFG